MLLKTNPKTFAPEAILYQAAETKPTSFLYRTQQQKSQKDEYREKINNVTFNKTHSYYKKLNPCIKEKV